MTWADYMETATKGQRVIAFDPPAYVNRERRAGAHGDHATAADLRAHRGADRDPRADAYAESEPSETSEPTEEPTEEPRSADGDHQAGHSAVHADDLPARSSGPREDARCLGLMVAQAGPANTPPQANPPRSRTRLPVDQPSRTDGFIALISTRLGGPLGRHADPSGRWWNPLRVALLAGTLVYLAGVLFRRPCREGADHFKYLCYSDIGMLYPARGLMQGNTPYFDSGDYPVLEYPVLTGWFLEARADSHPTGRRHPGPEPQPKSRRRPRRRSSST